jgi:hypothetical protein
MRHCSVDRKKSRQQCLVEAILLEGIADSPPSIAFATGAPQCLLERRNDPKGRLSC